MSDEFEQIKELCKRKIQPLTDTVFRFHNPIWTFAPTSGEGASITGGRFNSPGLPTLYTSFDQHTAFSEVAGGASRKLVDPMLLCAYQVQIKRVISIVDEVETFSGAWRLSGLQKNIPMGHLLGTYNQQEDIFDAAIVPSYARPYYPNLVIYKWDSNSVKLFDPDGRLQTLFGSRYIK